METMVQNSIREFAVFCAKRFWTDFAVFFAKSNKTIVALKFVDRKSDPNLIDNEINALKNIHHEKSFPALMTGMKIPTFSQTGIHEGEAAAEGGRPTLWRRPEAASIMAEAWYFHLFR